MPQVQRGGLFSVRVWRLPAPLLAISSAPLGGGLGRRAWVLNAQVGADYARLDPDVHLGELADRAGLTGPGVGMMTAVDVRRGSTVFEEGVTVDATVGVRRPQWAAAPATALPPSTAGPSTSPEVGTVNIVAFLPEPLSAAALVNAVVTVTEAKAQALWDAGLAGTGTASDAVCVLCPTVGPGSSVNEFGGPRSLWGARLARAVHRAVLDGIRREDAGDDADADAVSEDPS
jgi:adenosylcobinamide amidohydrolase